MGADLILMISRGPKRLDVGKKAQAVEEAKRRLRVIQTFLGLGDDDARISFQEENASVFADIESAGREPEDYACNGEEAIEKFAQETVSGLLYAWVGNYRDSCSRDFADYRIFACGDTTWGDTPSGGAYEALQDADALGISTIFDIQ